MFQISTRRTDSNPFSSQVQIDDDDNISEKVNQHKRGMMVQCHKANYDADAHHPHHDSVPVILLDVLGRFVKGHVS